MERARLPVIAWFSGLSGSGKTTIAAAARQAWPADAGALTVLDGDELRRGLSAGLGFSPADRAENLRRAAEAACLLADAGVSVLAALITPTRADRQVVVDVVGRRHRLLWIAITTPLAVCEARDVKGLYRRARAGEIRQFTGLDAAFEPLADADLQLDGGSGTPAESAARLISLMTGRTPG